MREEADCVRGSGPSHGPSSQAAQGGCCQNPGSGPWAALKSKYCEQYSPFQPVKGESMIFFNQGSWTAGI